MKIDEEKKYILTNYKPAKKGSKAIDSDHFTLMMDVNLEIAPEKPQRREIFNFKNKQDQEVFKDITKSNYKTRMEKHTKLRHMVDSIEHKIAKIEAKENRDKVIKKFKRLSEDPENINLHEM